MKIVDERGTTGTLETADPGRLPDPTPVRLAEGVRVHVDASALTREGDHFRYAGVFEPKAPRAGDGRDEAIITAAEEELRVDKRERITGRVLVRKHVETETRTIDEPLLREEVEVERVPVDRVIDGPVETRRQGDVTIVPVVEERLVLRKELVLKEELHIRRRTSERHEPQEVTLRREVVDVERVPTEERRRTD